MNNTFIKASSDYAMSYTEHLVKRRADAKIILARLGIIFLAVALMACVAVVVFKFIPSIAVVAVLLIAFLVKILWTYTSIEYEYVIVSGTISVDKIYGARKRHKIIDVNLPSAQKILPFSDASVDGMKTIFALSSPSDEDAYCIIFKNDSGENQALVINVTKKALDMLRYYNKSTVVSDKIV